MRTYPKRVENYTVPFLVMAGVILFMAFFTIAAVAGFLWVVMSAALIELLLRGAEALSSARKARR